MKSLIIKKMNLFFGNNQLFVINASNLTQGYGTINFKSFFLKKILLLRLLNDFGIVIKFCIPLSWKKILQKLQTTKKSNDAPSCVRTFSSLFNINHRGICY
jgi:hypothetical protein